MNKFEMTTGYFGPRVRGKLAGQRKARDWSVSPVDDGTILVQGDGCIGQLDFRTRKGVLKHARRVLPAPLAGATSSRPSSCAWRSSAAPRWGLSQAAAGSPS